jgi:hypothetical protein
MVPEATDDVVFEVDESWTRELVQVEETLGALTLKSLVLE